MYLTVQVLEPAHLAGEYSATPADFSPPTFDLNALGVVTTRMPCYPVCLPYTHAHMYSTLITPDISLAPPYKWSRLAPCMIP